MFKVLVLILILCHISPPGQSKDGPPVEAGAIKRERPHSTMSMPYSRPSAQINKMQPVLPPLGPKPKSRAVAPPKIPLTGGLHTHTYGLATIWALNTKSLVGQETVTCTHINNNTTYFTHIYFFNIEQTCLINITTK